MAKKKVQEQPQREVRTRRGRKKYVVLIVLITAGITGLAIFGSSIKTVEFNEFALLQNTINKQIDDKVYEAGIYFVPFHDFIRFNSTWQTIEFSEESDADAGYVNIDSKEGVELQLEMSFQFKLKRTEIYDLYKEFGKHFKDFYVKVAREVIRNVASDYNVSDFYANRAAIDRSMGLAIKNESTIFRCEIGEFQLRNIAYPEYVEDQIEQLIIAQQKVKIAEYEYQETLIKAQTLIVEAQTQYNITIIEAEATAEALNITLTAEGIALFNFANQIGFNNTQLLSYLWISAIQDHDESYLIIGIDAPVIIEP